ncbi:MAG: immunity 26/phosphotriesterase HocA family protein [Clostridia bacterium]|nr:immunity 26/phosphotriesterase HocA family protein [Clostridia bacterium]
MYELTNEQRKCFALPAVKEEWKRIEVKKGPYDTYDTYAYLDGQQIMKVIQVYDVPGQEIYREYSVNQSISVDGTKLLPKTSKGKMQNFIASYLENKTPVGMAISFNRDYVAVVNNDSEQCYYRSAYSNEKIESLNDFKVWVEEWCKNTGEKELADINDFSKRKRVHQKYREGDFFRFKINRSLYGYGRILLNFDQMRKDGTKFWEIFMGKPLCVAVYHMATPNPNVSPEELLSKKMLPSQMIMDNIFYYGECDIIGNLPIEENEKDYPIHYGKSISLREPNTINYQCGKTFVSRKFKKELGEFRNGGIGWDLNVKLPILNECINSNSNEPYWEMISPYEANQDLRNPKFRDLLKQIKHQMRIK